AGVGVLIPPLQEVVFHCLIGFALVCNPEVDTVSEILSGQKKRFVGVGRGSETADCVVSGLVSHLFETKVRGRQGIFNAGGLSFNGGVHQPGPALQRMETEAAFITKPALVHLDVSPSDGAVNLSFGVRIAGNAAAEGPRGMIDAEIAARAAAGADRTGALKKP